MFKPELLSPCGTMESLRAAVNNGDVYKRQGHMFPLIAKAGGVLERNGHTEATVDLMKLAGLKECGLCCEIMSDDGKMMRTDEPVSYTHLGFTSGAVPTISIRP